MKRPGRMIRQVLSSAMHKPITSRYPFVKAQMPQRFRGKLAFDQAHCIGCKICERDCPSSAIVIRKVADKKFVADIDLGRCIYCAQCVDSCPKKVLLSTDEFELAQLDRSSLKLTYSTSFAPTDAPASPPPPPPPAPKPGVSDGAGLTTTAQPPISPSTQTAPKPTPPSPPTP